MHVTVIPAREIDQTLRCHWQTIQKSNPIFANPYFCVEYTEAVATVRDDIFIGVIENDNQVIGFFPFQKKGKSAAGPVGGRLSDYQGLIVSPERELDINSIMKGCCLKIWDFDHLLASQRPFAIYHRHTAISPVIDISQGFNKYLKVKTESGSKLLKQLQRKARKFEREKGGLRLELYSDSEEAFWQVIEWKQEQCRRTGVPDFLSWGWTTDMLEQIWRVRTDMFAGMLSVLYHENQIVAAHFGMRSDMTFHWWFPTYSRKNAKYSPGGILLLKLIESLAEDGLSRIDLGKGHDTYKSSFATGGILLAEGSVMLPSVRALFHKVRLNTEGFLRYSPFALPIRAPLNITKKLRRWLFSLL